MIDVLQFYHLKYRQGSCLNEKFHELINSINDNEILYEYFYLLSHLTSQSTGSLYKTLTSLQKKELLLSYEESFFDSNLLSNDEVKSQYRKWLEEK